ncbi:DDE-type integrase/transposase/recombinase (plasmid) [Rhodococcus erythropolis]|uniref:Mu transposase C-terminal domain-containing protein n=1 Tax=Rhodococcus qingshengii JCM 15477 TaxID=1303681 RepID=A0AB38RP68_RHOSG|nr:MULTISPECIES: Mu transposase C-terminal domain-containing protein [Rhodococcus]MBY6386611.1 DDE-type integrase/transposase/recombinase [Rhodococcus erythropolis]MBY6388477.1 DDE-type integrase/transposase/recombinase [Rhodococcus erythropolis]MBY6388708.1 DDE-type integrase/transposase/recombinase [Rhodococcus erythropolis]MBY6389449.1 DDE-type integrase/transposase/recombinase [Rhodococcus erythropolis]MBY6389603.1 DDE-type integrase/transposase/recombinase [Rhodococcus erythropolis]
MTKLLKVGDRIFFDDDEHLVVALSGVRVRLEAADGTASVVLVSHLVDSPGFAILGQSDAGFGSGGLAGQSLADVPANATERARDWERHVVEVQTGLPPGADPGATPRPEYDPARTTIRQREAAKAAELTAAGFPTSAITVQRMRSRYRSGGVRGLVDGRVTRPSSTYRRTDERVVAAVLDALDGETKRSTGTRDRLRRQVEMLLVQRHGDGAVAMPSKATFNRLVTALSTGQHTFGSAKTRRSAANRPTGPFTATWASRPGQHVQIDTTPLDVLAVFDDGSARRVELTAAVDVATRTIAAGVLRPVGTKAVDASMLLARMLVPEPMRPGWAETLRMSVSRLPYRSLADIDIRMEQAAAKPVIVPETIGCDRGKVYLSETFLRSCQTLGMSVQPSHPRTPTDNSVIERTFSSINTLFCQYVAGYVGRDVGRRGAHVEDEAAWSLAQLQDLFDEWVIHWQRRPHDGLRSPDSGQAVSPNEMYAVLVSAAGYLPLMLSGEDYIELLPSQWRAINDYGVRLDRRTYDDRGFNPYRRQHSGVTAHNGAWEVRYDPYDLSQVFVRNHYEGGWIRATWTHLPMVSAPFADFTWRHARQIVADAGPTAEPVETATARALADLLDRASAGPDTQSAARTKADRKVAARTRAAAPERATVVPVDLRVLDGGDDFDEDSGGDEGELGTVIPFGVFDAAAEAERWL